MADCSCSIRKFSIRSIRTYPQAGEDVEGFALGQLNPGHLNVAIDVGNWSDILLHSIGCLDYGRVFIIFGISPGIAFLHQMR